MLTSHWIHCKSHAFVLSKSGQAALTRGNKLCSNLHKQTHTPSLFLYREVHSWMQVGRFSCWLPNTGATKAVLHLFGKPGCGPLAWCFTIYIHTESVFLSRTQVSCKQLTKHPPCIRAVNGGGGWDSFPREGSLGEGLLEISWFSVCWSPLPTGAQPMKSHQKLGFATLYCLLQGWKILQHIIKPRTRHQFTSGLLQYFSRVLNKLLTSVQMLGEKGKLVLLYKHSLPYVI